MLFLKKAVGNVGGKKIKKIKRKRTRHFTHIRDWNLHYFELI